jgi:hypothetical protein
LVFFEKKKKKKTSLLLSPKSFWQFGRGGRALQQQSWQKGEVSGSNKNSVVDSQFSCCHLQAIDQVTHYSIPKKKKEPGKILLVLHGEVAIFLSKLGFLPVSKIRLFVGSI